jgi:UDP:flavonoid glycosyltransferase YjiC (YdhE family)
MLTTAIEGLSTLDAHVVVAAGRVPLDQFGDVPDNVTVQAWVPQAELLPHVDVVVHHGGSGTMLGALSVGVPQLVLPQGADQFANADALSSAGAALCLLPDELGADAIAELTGQLLRQPSYLDAARAVAEEIARMPSPDDVAHQLPDYARTE